MRSLLFGACAGALLATLRAPLGLDVTELAVADPATACFWRGLAFWILAAAVALAPRALPAPVPIARLVVGAVLGWLLVALLLDPWLVPSGRAGLAVAALAGFAVLVAVGAAGRAPLVLTSTAPDPPLPVDFTAQTMVGAGLAVSFDALAQWLRLFGAGRPVDDAAFALVLLAFVAIGLASFRELLRGLGLARGRVRAPALASLSAVAAALAAVGIWFLGQVATSESFEPFLRALRSSPYRHGQWDYDGLVAARAFALPGLALGAALSIVLHRGQLCALFLGAGLAHLVLPGLRARFAERAVEAAEAGTIAANSGAVLALIGALIALAVRRQRPRAVWLVTAFATAVVLATAIWLPRPDVVPLDPWQLMRPDQDFGRWTSGGYVSVEWAPGFSRVVTVDRRRQSPITDEERGDRLQLELSVGLLPPETLDRGARVLLLGQLTPARARTFSEAGIESVDRTAPWYACLEEVEAALFEEGPPPGERLAPEVARRRLADGYYDLAVAPAVRGAAFSAEPGPLADRTILAAWMFADSGAAARGWSERVACASDGLLDLAIGVVQGPADGARGPQSEGLFEARRADVELWPVGGARRGPSGARVLFTESFFSARDAGVACAERLAAAAAEPRQQALARGLVRHLSAQRTSPRWDRRAAGLELDLAALSDLSAAARLPEAPGAFLAHLWEQLAEDLVDLRQVQTVFEEVLPIAEAHPFWPRLERALARGDLEFLDAESAAERLVRLVEIEPLDIELRLACALALSQAQRHGEAARQLRRADALQPGRRDIRRQLAMAMVRGGEAGGRGLIGELLEEDPEDLALEPFLGPGPFPAVETTFDVTDVGGGLDDGAGGHEHEHEHDEEPAGEDG